MFVETRDARDRFLLVYLLSNEWYDTGLMQGRQLLYVRELYLVTLGQFTEEELDTVLKKMQKGWRLQQITSWSIEDKEIW